MEQGGRKPFALGVAAVLATLIGGCGGEGGESAEIPTPPPPGKCVQLWNGQGPSKAFGRHVYNDHGGRQGRATEEQPGPGAINIRRGDPACAVVFAVPRSDEEYGEVGLAQTRFGWASMRELHRRDPEALDRLQEEAGLGPNVNVFPDGTISPR